MSGAFISCVPDTTQAVAGLEAIEERLRSPRPAWIRTGSHMVASVQENFEDGGRPDKWPANSALTLLRKKSKRILVERGFAGGLLGSINAQVRDDGVAVGTNLVYGAAHQFGMERGYAGVYSVLVKAYERKTKKWGTVKVAVHRRLQQIPWGDIPARPFLVVQVTDRAEILAIWQRFITEGEA